MNNQDIKFLLETLDDIKGSLRTIAKELERGVMLAIKTGILDREDDLDE